MNSEDGAQYEVHAIHKRDPQSVVSTVFFYVNSHISSRRQYSDNGKSFNSLFCSKLSIFNAHCTDGILESLLAMMLLSNAEKDENQLI